MLACREIEADGPCPDRWLVIEPRHPWQDAYDVGEGDAQAFVTLRRGLARHGVTLVDVVIFDEELRWWSMHELSSGTMDWPGRQA